MKLASGTCTDPNPTLAMKWDYAYDGDRVRTSTLTTPYDSSGNPLTASLTSYYFGGAYETRSNGSIFKYYSFGGQSVVNEYKPATSTWTLSYMLTDHLGSVVAITNASGALVSQQRYLPFGGVRLIPNSQSLITDYGYTGQRNLDSNIGLMDYNARFYSPYLNHFTQPDSIVPDPTNPQDWSRYAYAQNNPIRYKDPSGHSYCSFSSSNEDEDCQYVRRNRNFNSLMNYVRSDIINKNNELKKELDPLEAMSMVIEEAANIYGYDWDGFLDATTYIFTGYYGHGAEAMASAGYDSEFDGFFDGDADFHDDFVDDSNQVRHFWAAFATAADPYGDNPLGEMSANFGNWWHDVATDGFGNDGATMKDYKLSITAIDLAAQVGNEIKTPSALAGVLLNHLGTNGLGYTSDAYINPHWWITPND